MSQGDALSVLTEVFLVILSSQPEGTAGSSSVSSHDLHLLATPAFAVNHVHAGSPSNLVGSQADGPAAHCNTSWQQKVGKLTAVMAARRCPAASQRPHMCMMCVLAASDWHWKISFTAGNGWPASNPT